MVTVVKGSEIAAKLQGENGANAVPSGFEPTTSTNSGTSGGTAVTRENNFQGTSGNDVVVIDQAWKAPNQTVRLGEGDDVFRFGGTGSGALNSKVNAIVSFGEENRAGENDTVFLADAISDYKFTLRSGEGIKIQYIGSDPSAQIDGAAVTFYGAERFVFRGGVSDGEGTGAVHLTAEQLAGLVQFVEDHPPVSMPEV